MAEKGTPEESAEEASSLLEDLDAAWDAVEEPEQEEQQHEPEEAEAEPESSEEEEAAPEETQASGDSEAEEDEESDETPIEPPQHWAEEHKDTFRNLPPSAQEFVLQRHRQMEADYTRKSQEVAEVRKALEPAKAHISQMGVSEGEYVRRLAAADQYLTQNPKQGVEWLAKQYGVKLDTGEQGTEEDEFKDPYVQQLEEKVNALESQFQSRQQQEQHASEQQIQQQIEQFASEKDEKGDYKRPHFEQVKTHMGALMNSGAAESLEEAYDQAVWARPDLRSELLEQQKREAAQQEKQRRKEKAQKAKKATTPASTGATTEAPEPAADLRTDLERNWETLAN